MPCCWDFGGPAGVCSALGPVCPGWEASHPVRPRQWVGEIQMGKMGLVPMKPYRGDRGGPSHLSPRFLPIRANGLWDRSPSGPSLGNASPSIISRGRAHLEMKRLLGSKRRGREGGVKEREGGRRRTGHRTPLSPSWPPPSRLAPSPSGLSSPRNTSVVRSVACPSFPGLFSHITPAPVQ